jgi:hypothetical protein
VSLFTRVLSVPSLSIVCTPHSASIVGVGPVGIECAFSRLIASGELTMTTVKVFNKRVRDYPDDAIADSMLLAIDDSDDLEEFPVLLQSRDVRELIAAARQLGLSATGLARLLVRNYLRRSRGILSVGDLSKTRSGS